MPGAARPTGKKDTALKVLLLVSVLCNVAWLVSFMAMAHRQHTQHHALVDARMRTHTTVSSKPAPQLDRQQLKELPPPLDAAGASSNVSSAGRSELASGPGSTSAGNALNSHQGVAHPAGPQQWQSARAQQQHLDEDAEEEWQRLEPEHEPTHSRHPAGEQQWQQWQSARAQQQHLDEDAEEEWQRFEQEQEPTHSRHPAEQQQWQQWQSARAQQQHLHEDAEEEWQRFEQEHESTHSRHPAEQQQWQQARAQQQHLDEDAEEEWQRFEQEHEPTHSRHPAGEQWHLDEDAEEAEQRLEQEQRPQPELHPAHFSPEALAQQQERNRQPVDVVYCWINGSDPQLQQDLRQYKPVDKLKSGGEAANPSRTARFSAGKDELRYSIRALEAHMPWYRHLFIVTNGQVPRWLNTSNPRVTIVPESSIFRNSSGHLPTFNSNAVQSNLVNIPGLSESFIQIDDDWFLTQNWTMRDFVGPDGGQLLTGGKPTTMVVPGTNPYLHTIKNLDAVFSERFGVWKRTDPAHAPHFMQRYWLQQLQEALRDMFDKTSAARFRTPHDAPLSSAYQWWVSRFQPGEHPTHPDSMFKIVMITSAHAMSLQRAALSDWEHGGRKGSLGGLSAENAAAAVAEFGRGSNLNRSIALQVGQLKSDWSKPAVKVVCLQDEVSDSVESARQLLDPVVREFLQWRYPVPSEYELPRGHSNACSRRLRTMAYGQLPSAADYAEACV